MNYQTFELHWGEEKLVMRQYKGESTKETILREFGWLLKPIMEKTKSFDNSLDKLNWKVVTK